MKLKPCMVLVTFAVIQTLNAFQVKEPYPILPINQEQIEVGKGVMALVNANYIDVSKGELLPATTLIIEDGIIKEVGKQVPIPNGAEIVNAEGRYLLPGLIDVHFHLGQLRGLPGLYLQKGITSLRDPGAWIGAYGSERRRGNPLPRLYLTGPHLDMHPPAHPRDALIVRDAEEGRLAVRRLASQGASAIKVYYRLPLGTIKAICEEAHTFGLPVTAHLEIHNATEVVEAGVDGIEHITSLGLATLPQREAEIYRQKVLADNEARKTGRYELWEHIDPSSEDWLPIFETMKAAGVFLCPTLAIFEANPAQDEDFKVKAFENMKQVTCRAFKAGVKIAVGSHSYVPYAEFGDAYYRELELLVEAGLSPGEVIKAATFTNSGFLNVSHELGTLEVGRWADLILLEKNPLEDITSYRSAKRVMQAGKWVGENEAL